MLLIGANNQGQQIHLNPAMANRHGLIAGATGTGKTVTLQILTEQFSKLGVPVFTADVKGDLSGLAGKCKPHPKVDERIEKIAISGYQAQPSPVIFWDMFGKKGHPIRTTISEMGPVLLANLLELNDTQEGVLHIAFTVADEQGLLILDLKDLRSLLIWMSDNRKELSAKYGNIAAQSIGAIQRKLHVLNESGGDHFFGEPALDIKDFMRTHTDGRGICNVLDSRDLMLNPRIYATFLLWLLSELFEELEEVGDPDKPRLVFFFDEAHLLFDNAPKPLLQRIEQVVRLIRSKGVGIFFVTQHPSDIPDSVLGQLGNRIQHALRAYTPKDIKAVKLAAQSFRTNPKLDTTRVITELGVGEALVSTLDHKGRPGVVEQTLIRPPESLMGPISQAARKREIKASPIAGVYDKAVDRESAYELLQERAKKLKEREAKQTEEAKRIAKKKAAEQKKKLKKPTAKKRSNRQSAGEAFLKSVLRTLGNGLGKKILRGILGSITGGR